MCSWFCSFLLLYLTCILFCSVVVCYDPDNKEKYKVGETFTLGNCSKTCRCNENGEISCTPMCSKIKCGKGKRPRGKGVIAVGENRGCSCEIQECVPGIPILRHRFNSHVSIAQRYTCNACAVPAEMSPESTIHFKRVELFT